MQAGGHSLLLRVPCDKGSFLSWDPEDRASLPEEVLFPPTSARAMQCLVQMVLGLGTAYLGRFCIVGKETGVRGLQRDLMGSRCWERAEHTACASLC